MTVSTKKLSIVIDAEIHRELKRCALDEDTTITSLIKKLIENYLAKEQESSTNNRKTKDL